MDIELLVVADRPYEAAAGGLSATALADIHVLAAVTRRVIASEDQARQRGFTGSPTVPLDGFDPLMRPEASHRARLPVVRHPTRPAPHAVVAGLAPGAQDGRRTSTGKAAAKVRPDPAR
jgi:hypothetical protein